MAVIQKRGDSYRVLIRKKGHAAVSKTFKTKALAERWSRDAEHKMDEGKFAVDKATVADTVEEYIKRMQQIGNSISGFKLI